MVFGHLFGIGQRETTDSDNAWSLWFNGQQMQFVTFLATGNSGYLFPTVNVSKWHHYAITRSNDGTFAAYLDGQRISLSTMGAPVYEDGTVHMGCDIDFAAPVDYLAGAVADVRFYKLSTAPRSARSSRSTSLRYGISGAFISRRSSLTALRAMLRGTIARKPPERMFISVGSKNSVSSRVKSKLCTHAWSSTDFPLRVNWTRIGDVHRPVPFWKTLDSPSVARG